MKNKIICITSVIFLLGMGTTVYAQNQNPAMDHQLYKKVLNTYVNEQGKVNYEGLKKERSDLDALVKQIEKADISSFSAIEQKAFWINAYNAITLRTVVNKYPVRSIRLIDFGLVWEIPKNVAQRKFSLGHIEHKIVRPLGDPRIHFALNCASIGCPKLPREPFDPNRLDEQLDRETIRFINDPEKVRLDRSTQTLYHSEIFEWFREDFLLVSPDILSYIKKYINEDDRAYLENNKVMLKHIKYDWDINKQ